MSKNDPGRLKLKGKSFEADFKFGYKTGYRYSRHHEGDSRWKIGWWSGSGNITQLETSGNKTFLFETKNKTISEMYSVSDEDLIDYMFVFYRKGLTQYSGDYVEKLRITDESELIDILLNDIWYQVNQETTDPIPSICPKEIQVLELIGRGLTETVGIDDIIDAVYYNMSYLCDDVTRLDSISSSPNDNRFSLEGYGIRYNCNYYSKLCKSADLGYLIFVFGDSKLPVIFEDQQIKLLGKSLIYVQLNDENFMGIKEQVEAIKERRGYEEIRKLNDMFPSFVIPDRQDEEKVLRLFRFNDLLYTGELERRDNQVYFHGGIFNHGKLDNCLYDGDVVPRILDLIRN